MARSKEFDRDTALDGAIQLFSAHGFEGTSAQMLVDQMRIGRQSLYDTFGDKWRLYREAVKRYGVNECAAHREALRGGQTAMDGIEAMLNRVVETAAKPCLGVSSIYEFGTTRADLIEVNAQLGRALAETLREQVVAAQREGDISSDIDPLTAAQFLISTITSLRVSGRGGMDREGLDGLLGLALRALR